MKVQAYHTIRKSNSPEIPGARAAYARAVSAEHSHRCHSPRKHDRHTATFVETLCVLDDPSLTQSLLEFPEHINKNTSWEIVDVYVHQSLVRLNNI